MRTPLRFDVLILVKVWGNLEHAPKKRPPKKKAGIQFTGLSLDEYRVMQKKNGYLRPARCYLQEKARTRLPGAERSSALPFFSRASAKKRCRVKSSRLCSSPVKI